VEGKVNVVVQRAYLQTSSGTQTPARCHVTTPALVKEIDSGSSSEEDAVMLALAPGGSCHDRKRA
jgi:hypothetical protein